MTPEKAALVASIRASVRLLAYGARFHQLEDDIDALAALPDAPPPLTDERIAYLRFKFNQRNYPVNESDFKDYARAIEAEVRKQFGVKI